MLRGRPVKLTDPPISCKRAEELAWNLHSQEAERFKASLPGVRMTQGEFDLYLDFTGQYGIGNWRGSGTRRNLLATVTAPTPDTRRPARSLSGSLRCVPAVQVRGRLRPLDPGQRQAQQVVLGLMGAPA